MFDALRKHSVLLAHSILSTCRTSKISVRIGSGVSLLQILSFGLKSCPFVIHMMCASIYAFSH